MVPPGAFSKQLESGHEFTRKRLVEMEGVFFGAAGDRQKTIQITHGQYMYCVIATYDIYL